MKNDEDEEDEGCTVEEVADEEQKESVDSKDQLNQL